MNVYESLYRHLLLPTFDGLIKGRKTLRYLHEADRSQWLDRRSLEARQWADLLRILEYAYHHCEFYRESWDQLGLSPKELTSYEDFVGWPLLTRDTIREQRTRLQTCASIKRIAKSTGGSTGHPLEFDIDPGSSDRRTAMSMRGYDWAGCGPGVRRLLIWGANLNPAGSDRSMKERWHDRFHHQLHLNCFDFATDKMLAQFRAMQRFQPKAIVAYTNPLYEFARYLESHDLRPSGVGSIVVGAEKLYDFQRTLIERVFRAPVFETYGSREFMLIGAECERHSGMHLSMENLFVEIVDDDGRPTPAGNVGNVVITDLFNRAMPFIRYVNGDQAIAGFAQCECGRGLPLLQQVVGRRLDLVNTMVGETIPGEFFPHLFKDYPWIRRFQVQQRRLEEIEIRVVTEPSTTDASWGSLKDRLDEQIGRLIHVRLEAVAEIPLTPAGKLQVVVNHLANAS